MLHYDGQWAVDPCLELTLVHGILYYNFREAWSLNYLHGTPQSFDQAMLVVQVLLEQTKVKEKKRKEKER